VKINWFREGDTVITAYPESCSGPGWANWPVWVIVRDREGKLRSECLQPEQQSAEMGVLFGVCEKAHAAITNETRRQLKALSGKSKGKK
jgi:hypothetical protein